MKQLKFTEPKRRLVLRLASRDDYRGEGGEPNVPALAKASGLSWEITRYILDGTLPAAARAKPRPKPVKEDA